MYLLGSLDVVWAEGCGFNVFKDFSHGGSIQFLHQHDQLGKEIRRVWSDAILCCQAQLLKFVLNLFLVGDDGFFSMDLGEQEVVSPVHFSFIGKKITLIFQLNRVSFHALIHA